jgi:hypothetical protein
MGKPKVVLIIKTTLRSISVAQNEMGHGVFYTTEQHNNKLLEGTSENDDRKITNECLNVIIVLFVCPLCSKILFLFVKTQVLVANLFQWH